jgi:hypothetical protein
MRLSSALALLLATLPSALADVEFSSPAAGKSVPGGTAFTVTWTDSGAAPALVDLTSYQLVLFTGSNTQPQQLLALKQATFAAGNTVSVTVPLNTGAATKNA